MEENIKKILNKLHYRTIGNHSALQVCMWTKRALSDEGYCYKQKFYGIKSHSCCQISPFISCQNECEHCWRPIEITNNSKFNIDSPEIIIQGCIQAQRKLLEGFKGSPKVNMKKWNEAQNPSQFAISLIGEPTLYPHLDKLISSLRKEKKSTFLVTNGLNPKALLRLSKNKALPTQLYLSLNSPNENMYNQWHKSKLKNAWNIFNKTLSIFPKLDTRKVIRMTLIKDYNEIEPENYAKLILKAQPDFIEVKSYMAVGTARKRFGYEKMLSSQEVRYFSKQLLKYLPKYKILDEQYTSRVVLLGKNKSKMKIKNSEI